MFVKMAWQKSNPMATQPVRDGAIHEMAERSLQKTKPVLSRQKPAARAGKLRTKGLLKQRELLAKAIKKSLGQP
jgi:hypothetical protein